MEQRERVMKKKPERKETEKNRRNHMKFLYSNLFSLLPHHLISEGGDHVADRIDRTIDYIQSLKASLETGNKKKDKLLLLLLLSSNNKKKKKRSYDKCVMSDKRPLDIQIHDISPDLDAVLVTGLKTHSDFCDVLRLLHHYTSEVALASFSSSGHSTFHVRHKKIGAEEMCRKLRGCSNTNDLGDSSHNHLDSTNWSVWDFDFQSNVWGWDLEVLTNCITS